MQREHRHSEQDFVRRQGHVNHAGGGDEHFFGPATEARGGFGHGALRRRVTRGAGRAIGVARVHHDGAHASFGDAQVRFGDGHRSRYHQILREDSRGGSAYIAAENGEIERAGFFQAAGGGGEAEAARKRRFRKSVLH